MRPLNGTVKLTKALADHDLWHLEPFSRGQAWVDLLLLANDRPRELMFRGISVWVDVGQLARSVGLLAQRWRWSRNKAEGFLEKLVRDGMIRMESSNVITIITLLNYEAYQGVTDKNWEVGEDVEGVEIDPQKHSKNAAEGEAVPQAEGEAESEADCKAEGERKKEVGSKEVIPPPPREVAGTGGKRPSIPTLDEVLAEGKRLDVPEAEVRGWYNRAAHPDNRFGLHRVMDWRFDLAEFWRKCGRGRRSGPEAVAESSAPRPPARELSPGMKRMSVEGALKRLAEQIANHPGTFAIASDADKGRLRDLHRLRKKLQAELTELDAELVP